jgi:hypothetical protein
MAVSWPNLGRAVISAGLMVAAVILAACVSRGPSASIATPDSSSSPNSSGAGPTTSSAPSPSGGSPEPTAGPFTQQAVAQVHVDGLRLRTGPGTNSPIEPVALKKGEMVVIVGAAQHVDGLDWYPIVSIPAPLQYRPTVSTGWIADGPDGSWLGDPTLSCPQAPHLADLLALGAIGQLWCYSGKQLTVAGWYPPLPVCGGCGGACDPTEAWMICSNIQHDALSTTAAETGFGPFLIRVDNPKQPITLPNRGNWVTVTGHLDDPDAAACAGTAPQGNWTPLYGTFESAAARVHCRIQFVVITARLGT